MNQKNLGNLTVMLPPENVGRLLRLCPECWTRGGCVAGRHLFLRVPSSMWRVVLHYPGLSSGSPHGPTVLCTTQLLLCVHFFPVKICEILCSPEYLGVQGQRYWLLNYSTYSLNARERLAANECQIFYLETNLLFSSPKASQVER